MLLAELGKRLLAVVGRVVLLDHGLENLLQHLLGGLGVLLALLRFFRLGEGGVGVDGHARVVLLVVVAVARGHNRVLVTLAQRDPLVLVDGKAVVAGVVVGGLGGVEQLAVRGAGVAVGQLKDLEGDSGVGLVSGGRKRAHVHVALGGEDVGRVDGRRRAVGHNSVVGGQVVILVDDVIGVVVVRVDVKVVGLGQLERVIVVRNPEVAGGVAVLVLEAPVAGEVDRVKAVAGLGAPAVLDQPSAVALGRVGRGVREALGKVGRLVCVVPAHDGHGVVGLAVVVGVVGVIGADVLGRVVLVAGRGVICREAHRDGATKVALVVGVVVQLVLDGGHAGPVDAGPAAVLVKDARVGQLVAVLEVHERGVPPRQVVAALLGLDGPVGVDVGLAVGALVVARVAALLPANDLTAAKARLAAGLSVVDLRLGKVLEVLLGAVGVVLAHLDLLHGDNKVDGLVGLLAQHAAVLVGVVGLKRGANARGKDVDTKGQPAAGVQRQVGVAAAGVVALAGLGLAHNGLGRAAVEVDRAGKLQLREVKARICVGLARLGQDGRLTRGDGRKAPAGAPGVLELDGGHDALVAQVVAFGVLGHAGVVCQGDGGRVAGGKGLVVGGVGALGGLGPDRKKIGVGSVCGGREDPGHRSRKDDGKAGLKAVP